MSWITSEEFTAATSSIAHTDGHEAHKIGRPREANPFLPQCEMQRWAWDLGWREAAWLARPADPRVAKRVASALIDESIAVTRRPRL
jgi:ribosome modulation factor